MTTETEGVAAGGLMTIPFRATAHEMATRSDVKALTTIHGR